MSPPPLSSCVFSIKLSTSTGNYSIVRANYTLMISVTLQLNIYQGPNSSPVAAARRYRGRCSSPSPRLMTIRSHLVTKG